MTGLGKVYAQSKVNISTSNPTSIHLCADAEWFVIDVRNITTSTLSGLTAAVQLPTGMVYEQGTVDGTGVTESSVSNLNKPVFSLPSIGLAKSSNFRIKIKATCSMISFLSGGGLPQVQTEVTYSGGSTKQTSSPLTILQPSVKISTITNQFATADLGTVITRTITVTNGGKGNLEGFSLRQIHQNGLTLTGFSGGSTSQNADTAWSVFTRNHFVTIGNKDSFLSQGESIVIYDTLYVGSCSNLRGYYQLSWGCDGSICTYDNASSNVTISTKAPKLVFTAKSNTTVCFSSSNPHLQELTIKNTGNDTARKVEVDIFQSASSGYYQYVFSQLDYQNVEMAIGNGSFKKITPISTVGTYSGNAYSCLGGGAIGAMTLQLPDIPANETIYLRWYSVSCCPTECDGSFYSHRWKYSGTYQNQCGTSLTQSELFGSYGYTMSYGMSSYTPSDIISGQTVELNFPVTGGSLFPGTSSSTFEVRLKLPKGVSHSKAKSHFFFLAADGSTWQPNTISQKSDTIVAVFKGSPTITLVRSELRIFVTGSCTGLSSNSDQSYNLDIFYNPDPSCKDACDFHLFCFTGSLRVHCDQSCTSGLRFSDFDARRITYGEPDNDNDGRPDASGSLDLGKIKLERVMVGDTLLTTFRAKINAVGSTTTWRYLNASSTIDYGKFLKVADVRLKIYRVGNLLYDCDGIGHSYSTSGNSRTFTFDVGVSALISAKCPLYSGFLFGTKDSVELEVRYVYESNPGNFTRETSLNNLMYLSTVANPNSSQRYQCDTFGGKFVMIGYYFTNYGKGNYASNSCNELEVSQNYYLSVGQCCSNYAGGNIFPFEYRNWALTDAARLILPKGFEFVNARVYHYYTAGTGVAKYQYIDTIKPSYQSGDTTAFDFAALHTSSGGPLLLSDDGFHGVVYYKIRANCQAQQGSSEIQYDYIFRGQNYLNSVQDTLPSNANSDFVIYDKPIIDLNVEQNNIKAKSDTAEWNIRIQNSSSVSDASFVWLSYQPNGNTRITEIRDKTTGQKITPVNDIFRLGDLASSKLRDLVVRAVFTNCQTDSFPIVAGFNCSGYPDSLADYPCPPVYQYLSYTPVNTRLSAMLTDSIGDVDLCSRVPFTVEITNEGEARVFNVFLDVIIRDGMVLSDTAWGFEPGTNDSFMVTNPTYRGNNTYRFSISSASSQLGAQGLAGFTSGSSNSMTFKFFLETNCNFVSATYFLVRPGGNLNCGLPVLSTFGIGKPINIKNVKKPYFSSLTVEMDKPDVCNYNGKIRFKFINLGPDTTGTKDKIQLLLPEGMYVDTSYLQSYYRGPSSKPDIYTGSQYKAEWPIPVNTVPGDSSFFEINTYVVSSELPCGYTQIVAQAVVKQPALCVKDSSICNIDVATSSQLLLDSIRKSIYQLDYLSGISTPSNGKEAIQFSYRVTNTGSLKLPSTPLVVKLIHDANQNGKQDAGENILVTDTIWSRMDTDSSVIRTLNFEALPLLTCGMALVIDSINCTCEPTFTRLPAIRIINAGRDTTLCALTDVLIGTPSLPGCTYHWSPTVGVEDVDSALTYFNRSNLSGKDSTFKLILETTKGSCKTRDTAEITLYPAMQVNLPDSYHLCRGDSVIVGELVQGGKGFKSYLWTPNYAIHSNTSVKVWAKPPVTTTYTIEVTDSRNCKLIDSTTVKVVNKPVASFTVTDTCSGELFQFEDNSTSGGVPIDSGFWDFGYLGTALGKSQAMFIDSSLTLSVHYRIKDSIGCEDDTIRPLQVYPLPNANFTPHDDCEADTFELVNQTSITSGTFTSSWLIDGQTYSSNNVTTSSGSVGDVPVQLTATSNRGCVGVYRDTFEIFAKPNIALQLSDVCLNSPSEGWFTHSSSSDTLLTNWISSNGFVTTDSIFRTTYSDTGVYVVTLYVETEHGCRDTAQVNHTVHSNPVAGLSISYVCYPSPTVIRSTSSIAKGKIAIYQYDLGAGYGSGADSLIHSYSMSGPHPINHIVTSDHGCSDTTSDFATVYAIDRAGYTITGNCAFEPISLSADLQNMDSVSQVRWYVNGNDSVLGTTGVYTFTNSGVQTLRLQTTTLHGCVFDSSFTLLVDPKPTAEFTANLPCTDNQVNYSNTSRVLTGSLVSHQWQFGDGQTASILNPSHRFDSIKTYTTQLIVTSDKGCRDTTSAPINVPTIIVPDFVVDPVCMLDSVTIRHTTTGLLSGAYYWYNLGDGAEIFNENPSRHACKSSGTFNIKLTVSTAANCTYDTVKQVDVYPLPIPGFDLDPPVTDILNSDISIIDRSSGASVYTYSITDQSTYTTPEFTHHFADSGTYVIRQILENSFGCRDSAERTVHINYLVNILVPSAFTPDNDGKNDLFGPGGLGVVNYDLSIYNRWGELIYQTTEGKPWDGKDALMGVYYYSLKMLDYNGKPHYAYGTVSLIR
ncbi:MAG: gliding motility-associated C-terminal domain-containing protein [Bacteroidetes bacterium]|nr:gliding motility-associated C-terminal domain-containing protein [Bacteroidota bacterium]